jgi:hypothetical protein
MQLQHSVAQHCAHIHFTVYMCASWHDMCVLYTQCSMLVCCCIGLSVLRCNFAFPAGAARALAREEQREIQCESALARAERVRQLRDSDVVAKPRWLDRIDKTGVEHAAVGKLHPRAGAAGRADLQGQAGPVLRCVGSRPDSEAAPWTSSPGACVGGRAVAGVEDASRERHTGVRSCGDPPTGLYLWSAWVDPEEGGRGDPGQLTSVSRAGAVTRGTSAAAWAGRGATAYFCEV